MTRKEKPNFHKISEVFFPTNVVVIDDDKTFGDILVDYLPKDYNTYTKFVSPHEAIKYIKDIDNKVKTSYCSVSNQQENVILDINITDIHSKVFDDKRFHNVSTVIVDYDMHAMNGVEFLKQVKGNFQRILLTGVANESIAIQAFNDGIIDKYYRKQESDTVDKLAKSVEEYNYQYFKKENQFTDDFYPEILKDNNFIDTLNHIIKQNNIVEYYLLDHNGSFYLFDNKGNLSIFYIFTDSEIDSIYEVANESGCDEVIKESIRQREKIIYYNELDEDLVAANWDKYLYEIQKLTGEYYYTYISRVNWNNNGKMLSFDQHLNYLSSTVNN